MRQNVLDYIQTGKAQILADAQKRVKTRENEARLFLATAQNTIFTQYRVPKITKTEFEAMKMAHAQLLQAQENIASALVALNEFHHLDLKELKTAGGFCAGYIYFFDEFANQQSPALNTKARERGWGHS